MPKLLIIDDEQSVLFSLVSALSTPGLDIVTAETGRSGLRQLADQAPDAVLCDIRLPDMTGLEVYDAIRLRDSRVPVIMATAYSTTETAIEAMKRGAFEYLLKPFDLPQLREVVTSALEQSQLARVPALFEEEQLENLTGDRILGHSSVMHDVYKMIGRTAGQDVTVLIRGESGTGKELVARALYQHSQRSRQPFLAMNCAAIPEPLLESELFGHERGSFTGADRRRVGKFEQAHGGTIFLDEIGDMAASTQAKMLRLLQSQQFERLGGNETIQTDVRVIAATNQDLDAMVAAGTFRLDLFYRLNGFTIQLPPLRERTEDIPLLAEHFRKRVNSELGRQIVAIAPEVLQRLLEYSWPGNVRELHGAIRFAAVHAPGEVITLDSLPDSLRRPQAPVEDIELTGSFLSRVRQLITRGEPQIYQAVHNEVDRLLLTEVMRHCHSNQVAAAELLGIARNTLRAKLRSLGLQVEKKLTIDDSEPLSD